MKRMIIGAALAAVTLFPVAPATAAPADTLFPGGLPWAISKNACVDGVKRCVWHAPSRGNRKGRSYILTWHRSKKDFVPTYIRHRRAARLTRSYCARPRVTCRGY